MMRTLMLTMVAAAFVAACASGGRGGLSRGFDDVAAMQRRLDDRGIGFGVTRVPGEDAILLQVRFRPADEVSDRTESTAADAAAAVAPSGCRVASVTAQPDGTYKAAYDC
jgi:hypothetical protein